MGVRCVLVGTHNSLAGGTLLISSGWWPIVMVYAALQRFLFDLGTAEFYDLDEILEGSSVEVLKASRLRCRKFRCRF